GIDTNLAEVHRSWVQAVHLGPGFTFVLGPEHTAFAVFNDGVYDVRVFAIDVEADSAGVAFRKPVSQLARGSSDVDSLVDAASRPASIESPTTASSLIRAGIQSLGIRGVHRDIDSSRVIINSERLFPGQTTVGCHVNAALRIRAPQMAERCDVNNVG